MLSGSQHNTCNLCNTIGEGRETPSTEKWKQRGQKQDVDTLETTGNGSLKPRQMEMSR